jgi:hypothetical protein
MRNSAPASWLNGEVKKFYLEMLSIFKDYSGFFDFSFNVFGFRAAKSRTFQYGACLPPPPLICFGWIWMWVGFFLDRCFSQ